jgi:cytochrome b561
MTMTNSTELQSYGTVHRTLHWTIFALLVVQYAVGLTMPHINNTTPYEGLVLWHGLIGAAILFFVLIRLSWRLVRPVPLEVALPAWQAMLAKFTHWMLYALLIVITVLGWAGMSFRGWAVTLFGIVPLPALAAKGTPWAHTAGDVHITLVYVLLGFIALHVAGALYHHFVLRDRTLQRMLPGV